MSHEAASGSDTRSAPFIFVTVGTDHHPFDRLVGTTEEWSQTAETSAFIQYGASRQPRSPRSAPFLDHEQMTSAIRDSVAVVSHGGPGTIMMARQHGKKPIVMPRQASLGEHVDDHQVRFAHRLSEAGEVHLAESTASLWALLDATLTAPERFLLNGASSHHVTDTVRHFEEIVNSVLARRAEATRSR